MSQWAGTMDSGAIGVPMKVGPFDALTRAVRGSFQTRGRSSRTEFWWFQLFLVLFFVLGLAFDAWRGWSGVALLIAVVVSLPASISVCVRRLHDAGYSGAFYFVQFLPFIGGVWLLVLTVQPSKRLQNEYGPGPDDVLLH
jgi:uncharacterized membrane protein YhaH (DUF805 family)